MPTSNRADCNWKISEPNFPVPSLHNRGTYFTVIMCMSVAFWAWKLTRLIIIFRSLILLKLYNLNVTVPSKGVLKIDSNKLHKEIQRETKLTWVATIPVIMYHFMTNCSAYPIYISKFTFYHAIPFLRFSYVHIKTRFYSHVKRSPHHSLHSNLSESTYINIFLLTTQYILSMLP